MEFRKVMILNERNVLVVIIKYYFRKKGVQIYFCF